MPASARRAALALVGLLVASYLLGAPGLNAAGSGPASPGGSSLRSDGPINGLPSVAAGAAPHSGSVFAVDFQEQGLPASTNWSIVFNGAANWSLSASIGFSAPNGTYAFSVGAVPGFDPQFGLGNVSVNGQAVTENVTFDVFTFPVTFDETGLPGTTNWGVTLGGTPLSTSTNQVAFASGNGTYAFAIQSPSGYTAGPARGNVTVANDSPVVPIVFAPILYSVNFTEIGLNATNWTVNLSGTAQTTNGTRLSFEEPNGTFSFVVGPPSGFYATPASSSFTIAGAPVNRNITFTAIPPTKYPLTFNEVGLAPGTRWWANLTIADNSTTGTSLVYLKANGNLPFTIGVAPGYSPHPASGTAVINGGPTNISITFAAILYSVNFTEQGLPSGTSWQVEVGAGLNTSSSPTIGFEVANGSHAFAVVPVPGYRAAPVNGTAVVAGAELEVSIIFTAVNYTVTWSETGLPLGTSWSVRVAGQMVHGNAGRLTHPESNGTYPFVLGVVPGYRGLPPSGNVTVEGSNVVVTIAFSSSEYLVTFTEAGLTGGPSWTVSLAGAPQSGNGVSHFYSVPNGSYAFGVSSVPGFTVVPSSGNVTVAGANVAVALTFTPLPPGTYPVVFTESGLPSGTGWSIVLNATRVNASIGQIAFAEPNGTYSYTVGPVPGYRAASSNDSVSVQGDWVNVSVEFSRVAPSTFAITFTESGLAEGTGWSVELNGTLLSGAGPNLFANETNGTYLFDVSAVPGYNLSLPSGVVNVSGHPVEQSVDFSVLPAPRYSVQFTETGLPAGTTWAVTLNGTKGTGSSSTLSAGLLLPGTYAYTVEATGYSPTPATGNVTVDSVPVTVSIAFTPAGPASGAAAPSAISAPTLVFVGAMGIVLLMAIGIAVATRGGNRGH